MGVLINTAEESRHESLKNQKVRMAEHLSQISKKISEATKRGDLYILDVSFGIETEIKQTLEENGYKVHEPEFIGGYSSTRIEW